MKAVYNPAPGEVYGAENGYDNGSSNSVSNGTKNDSGKKAYDGPKKKVLIVNHRKRTLMGYFLENILNSTGEFEVCSRITNMDDVVANVDSYQPDLTIMEMVSNGLRFREYIAQIKEAAPKMKILVYSHLDEKVHASDCLISGANGFISMEESVDELYKAIQAVCDGKKYVSESMQNLLFEKVVSRKTNRNIMNKK